MTASYFDLVGFGPEGWGPALATATFITLAVALAGFAGGAVLGGLLAWARIAGGAVIGGLAQAYSTVMRGIPDLLVIYLFYFGGSAVLGRLAALFGHAGFIGVPAFLTGALAIAVVSAAYQGEVFRGAHAAVARGEIEAAIAIGMSRPQILRRILVPLTLRYALPGLGNTWQLVLKESALISVIGLVELLRQAQIAAGSTRRPFEFYLTAAALYLLISWVSTRGFALMERRSRRGVRTAG